MPELEEEIAQWRKRMAAGGIKNCAVLDELESHLREDIERRTKAGTSWKAACARTLNGEPMAAPVPAAHSSARSNKSAASKT